MDPKKFKTRMGDLALGTALGAAARDYKKEMEAQYKAQNQSATPAHEDVDFDELMDDPELEKLHADRLAALKKEAEKRQVLARKGHGEYREVTEAEFLGEVTGSEKLVCHFFHREFVRCKIMDKHLQSLTTSYFDTKFIKVDAERFCECSKEGQKPLYFINRNGVAVDRIVGFEELGGKDDFPRKALEARLLKKEILVKKQQAESEEGPRNVRSTTFADSDSD